MKSKNNIQKKIFIHVEGCHKRGLDAKKFSTYFSKNNCKIVNSPKYADYIIFFTCGVFNQMIDRCLDKIKKFKKYDAELIVAGCLPDIAKEKLENIFNGKIIPTKDIEKIDDIFKGNKIKFGDVDNEHFIWRKFNPFGGFLEEPTSNKTYWIVISTGCIYNCSYCGIKKAIGPLKSKPLEQCLKEFKAGLQKGYTDLGLDADDIGNYGIDIGKTFPELLDEITKIDGDYTLKLENIHPTWLIKYANELEEILKRKKISYICISVQSGSNTVLKRMRRPYTREDLLDAISKIQKACPDLKMRTEIIVGFPGETLEEFGETMELLKKIRFDKGCLFSFSAIDGTDANTMHPKLTRRIMHKRMRTTKRFLRNADYYVWSTGYWSGNWSISFQNK
jgi:MiaB/RimO family radical SAM methylthiotransferase